MDLFLRLKERFARAIGSFLVFLYVTALSGGDVLLCIPIFLLLLWIHYSLPLVYILWMYLDGNTPTFGSFLNRRCERLRRLFVWNYFRDYFPIHFHKTADLDPTKNYMFAFHPHGVFSISCFVNFITEAGGFGEKFPGLTIHPLTMDNGFTMPFWREVALAFGAGAVSKESINHKLTKLGQGHSVVLVPGGVADLELSDPANPYQIKLKNRRGFVREALRAGAGLVPVFSFGETDVLYTEKPSSPESLYGRFYAWCRRVIGGGPLMAFGTSFLIPYQKPIHTVVGAHLKLPHLTSPTDDEVNFWHAEYTAALKKVFYENRERFGHLDKDLELF